MAIPSFLTMLLIVFSVIFATTYMLRFENKSQHLCRQHVLETQKVMGTTLTSLLNLNAAAKSINSFESGLNIIQVIGVALLSPKALVVFNYIRKTVNALKRLIIGAQKNILFLGNHASRAHMRGFVSKFYKLVSKDNKVWSREKKPLSALAYFKPFQLAVKKKSYGKNNGKNKVPIYVLKKPFYKKQMLHAFWSSTFGPQKTGWLFSNFSKLQLKGECRSTLINQEGKWSPTLY